MKFVTDENISRQLVNALRRHIPHIDVVRIQDVGLQSASDEVILDWAQREDRIVITQDRATIPPLVKQNLAEDLPVPKVLIIRRHAQVRDVLEMIEIILNVSRSLSDASFLINNGNNVHPTLGGHEIKTLQDKVGDPPVVGDFKRWFQHETGSSSMYLMKF
jgi:predicted nuclease of predicted toxin-antitoxin system